MGYLNNVVGYRNGILEQRSFVKHGNCALLSEDGLVKNSVPGFENVDLTIMGSPRLGARFVDYRLNVLPGGTFEGFYETGVQTFIYVIEGSLTVTIGDEVHDLDSKGYAYAPADVKLSFVNNSQEETKAFLYKKIPSPVSGTGNGFRRCSVRPSALF